MNARRFPHRVLRRLRGGPTPPDESPFAAFAAVAQLMRDGAAALAPGGAAVADADSLDVAVVIPWYPRGSGGHATIFNLVRQLEARGHRCSIWLDDPTGRHPGIDDVRLGRELRAGFGDVAAEAHASFAAWRGADVALATSWPTAYRVSLLAGCKARAYLVQDHEPEFHPTSAESEWAAATYGFGFHCIAASRWLAELLRARYGASASHFDLGIDHGLYRADGAARPRSSRRVLFYARLSTARRAVPLGLLALDELRRRRPEVEIALFGAPSPLAVPFACEQLGLLSPPQLADAYRTAAVGIVLSLTNPSLVPLEMLASGLPCIDVDRPSTRSEWAPSDGVELVPLDPTALASAVERLLDDPALHARRSEAGAAWARGRTWAHAAAQVEDGLRTALRGA